MSDHRDETASQALPEAIVWDNTAYAGSAVKTKRVTRWTTPDSPGGRHLSHHEAYQVFHVQSNPPQAKGQTLSGLTLSLKAHTGAQVTSRS